MPVQHAFVFGYGSLVNPRFHEGRVTAPAEIRGWRREWCQTTLRPVPFLSVERDETASLAGLLAEVPLGDWTALDAREYAYDRHSVIPERSAIATADDVQLYAVATRYRATSEPGAILLSYLDVVIQGYAEVFGPEGVAAFFATTEGWDRPVLNDRAAPIYPRAQILTRAQRGLVDDALHALSAVVEQLE